jgi:hypothetical protein
MAQVVAGVVRRMDGETRRVVIGAEEFALLGGIAVAADVGPGTSVTALVIQRSGSREIIHIHANAGARVLVPAS